ncbi:6-bladed beta-propeller [candidate division KSB1 bacterium]
MFWKTGALILLIFLIVNCSTPGNDVSEPEVVTYSYETFVEADYTFLDEGLHHPIMMKQLTDDNLAVLDKGNSCVYMFSESGEFIRKIGKRGNGPGELGRPYWMDIDNHNNIFILEGSNQRISMFTSAGDYVGSNRVQFLSYMDHAFSVRNEITLICNGFGNSDYFITEFDNEGNLLKTIGDVPEFAPGDERKNRRLMFGYPFKNEENEYLIFLHLLNKIKIYSEDGVFLKEINYSDYPCLAEHFAYVDESAGADLELNTSQSGELQDVFKNNGKYYIVSHEKPVSRDFDEIKLFHFKIFVLNKDLHHIKTLVLDVPNNINSEQFLDALNTYGTVFEFYFDVSEDEKHIYHAEKYTAKILKYTIDENGRQ